MAWIARLVATVGVSSLLAGLLVVVVLTTIRAFDKEFEDELTAARRRASVRLRALRARLAQVGTSANSRSRRAWLTTARASGVPSEPHTGN
jgi:hypothetical protein